MAAAAAVEAALGCWIIGVVPALRGTFSNCKRNVSSLKSKMNPIEITLTICSDDTDS